jgi:hypothetical protein
MIIGVSRGNEGQGIFRAVVPANARSCLLLLVSSACHVSGAFPTLNFETKLDAQGRVALSGDTLVVYGGVFVRTDRGWIRQGRVYGNEPATDGDTIVAAGEVYVRSGTVWTEQQDSLYGGFPAVSSNTIAGSVFGASVQIWDREGTNWTGSQLLTLNERWASINSLALEGDTLVVGAPVTYGTQGVSSVYVFARRGSWFFQSKLVGEPQRQAPIPGG